MSLLKRDQKHNGKYQNPVPTELGGVGLMLKVLPMYIRNREETEPRRPLGPFRTDLALYATPPASGLRITWFGHSSLLLEIDGLRVLIDPVWEQRAGPFELLGPKRFYPPTLALEDMPELDAVLVSHDHYDHFGIRTLKHLAKLPNTARALWITSAGVGTRLAKLGVPESRIAGLGWMQSAEVPGRDLGAGLTITALPARHFSGRTPLDRMSTLWSSFVIAGPRHRVYFGADSGLWDGFADISREYGPFDVTMLEIGAYNELWASIHLGPGHAVEAFEAMQAVGDPGVLFPIHWGLFNLALHAWRQPVERLTELAAARNLPLWLPVPGIPTAVEPGRSHVSEWWK